MEKETKRLFLSRIARNKLRLNEIPEFLKDPELRAVYVALCTIEGAMMFGDLPKLGQRCAEFCKELADDCLQRN